MSRSGVALLRELTEMTGLVDGWTEQLLDTYKTFPTVQQPGRVLADLAVTIADGGDALSHLANLRDQDKLYGAVASNPTAWRAIERRRRAPEQASCDPGRSPRTGLGGRCRPEGGSRADDRHRRDDQPLAQREGERRGDLEEDLRLPPLDGLPGPS